MTQQERRLCLILAIAVTLKCLVQNIVHDLPYYYYHHYYSPIMSTTRRRTATRNGNGGRLPRLMNDSTSTYSHNKTKSSNDDLHSSHIAILPLREWEETSLQGLLQAAATTNATTINTSAQIATRQDWNKQIALDTCQPPPGIPKQCCLGTFAGMGRIIHDRRHHCAHSTTLDQMQHLQQRILTLFPNKHKEQECDICHILETLRRHNWTMAFVGDSMSHQTFQGFVCELYRRNYTVQESTQRFQRPQQQRQQRQRQRRGRTTTTNTTGHTNQQQDATITTIPTRCSGINHCLHMVRTIEISSPLWHDATMPKTVKIQFFHHYRLPFEDPDQEEMVLNAADVLVLNFGLHWGANYQGNTSTPQVPAPQQNTYHPGSSTSYSNAAAGLTTPQNPPTPHHLQQALADFLVKLAANQDHRRRRRRVQHVLFRETSAQHFKADGGDFSFVKHQQHHKTRQPRHQQPQPQSQAGSDQEPLPLQEEPLQCAPYQHGNTSGWREQVIRQAAQQANYGVATIGSTTKTTTARNGGSNYIEWDHETSSKNHVLKILPFAEFTQPLFQLHPYDERASGTGGGGGDCTHYCSTPFLYMPLWTSIRLAISS